MVDNKFCYQKIKEYIIEKIKNDAYQNNKIESENMLCQQFHTSRMTVRQAIASLQEEGYVYTLPKKGTYVCQTRPTKELDGLRSFTEDISQGGISKSKVVIFEKVENTLTQIASKYVWHIGRVRYSNEMAIAYEEGYFDAEIMPNLTKEVLENSIYAYIEEILSYKLDYATQEIIAVNDNEILKKLALNENTALLKITQTSYLSDGRCIEFCDTYYRCDIYTFRQNAYRGGRK